MDKALMLAGKWGVKGSQKTEPGEAKALAGFLMLHGSALGLLPVFPSFALSFSFFSF